jgi:lipoprotein-anchoring transpeptidase ErfK/SrfK
MIDLALIIFVSIPEQKMYVATETEVITYTVSTGSEQFPTPAMDTVIDIKYDSATIVNPPGFPVTYRIEDVPYIMCPQDNPEYCIHPNLSDTPVGTQASFGCVRMRESDAKELFDMTSEGTPYIILG